MPILSNYLVTDAAINEYYRYSNTNIRIIIVLSYCWTALVHVHNNDSFKFFLNFHYIQTPYFAKAD